MTWRNNIIVFALTSREFDYPFVVTFIRATLTRLSAFLLNATTIPQARRTDPRRRCDCTRANIGEAALVSAQCERRGSVDRFNQQNVLRDFPRAIFTVKLLKIREVWNAMREIGLGYTVSCLHLLDWIYVCTYTYTHTHTAALRLIIYVSRELERCTHSREMRNLQNSRITYFRIHSANNKK